ncbi:MAG: ABC transporter permease subunit [Eubacteriaceae bacterium]
MTLAKLEFKSIFRGLLAWTGTLGIILVLFMVFFPTMETATMQSLVGVKLDGVPLPVLKVLGLTGLPDFSNIIVFIGYVMQYLNIAIVTYATILGAVSLIKEETEGTIEFLYGQPVTRRGIVLQKMLANALAYFLLVITLGIMSMMLAMVFSSGRQEVWGMLVSIAKIFTGTFVIGFIFMAIGFLVSSKINRRSQAGPFALCIVFGTYILGMFALIVEALDFLRYLSPLEVFKPSILIEMGFNGKAIGLWGIAFCICLLFTFLFYERRDLNV